MNLSDTTSNKPSTLASFRAGDTVIVQLAKNHYAESTIKKFGHTFKATITSLNYNKRMGSYAMIKADGTISSLFVSLCRTDEDNMDAHAVIIKYLGE